MTFKVELKDGTVYTGWRAIPWLLILLPVWLPWYVWGFILQAIRRYTGRTHILGWAYVGNGTWERKP